MALLFGAFEKLAQVLRHFLARIPGSRVFHRSLYPRFDPGEIVSPIPGLTLKRLKCSLDNFVFGSEVGGRDLPTNTFRRRCGHRDRPGIVLVHHESPCQSGQGTPLEP
jgi:hypothetical protein